MSRKKPWAEKVSPEKLDFSDVDELLYYPTQRVGGSIHKYMGVKDSGGILMRHIDERDFGRALGFVHRLRQYAMLAPYYEGVDKPVAAEKIEFLNRLEAINKAAIEGGFDITKLANEPLFDREKAGKIYDDLWAELKQIVETKLAAGKGASPAAG